MLGCTHYAFLAPVIRRIAGQHTHVINTDLAVARETARRLESAKRLSPSGTPGRMEFWSSAATGLAGRQIQRLWDGRVTIKHMR